MLEKETNEEEVVIAVEDKVMTLRKESSLTEEAVAEEAVTTITATEDPAPHQGTMIAEEMMIAAEMTMVAIPATWKDTIAIGQETTETIFEEATACPEKTLTMAADVVEIEEIETIIETTETTETKETSEAVAEEVAAVIEEEAVVADTTMTTTESPQVTESLKGKYTIQTH